MEQSEQSSLILSVIDRRDGYEHDVVAKFGERLISLARYELPSRLSRRLDPEDIVQSVFRSFFQRHEETQFSFADANDVWRLLVTMTYHKVANSVVFHQRQRRDQRREVSSERSGGGLSHTSREPTADDLLVMMDLLDTILARLPDSAQRVVRLRLENYTAEEVAAMCGISRRTVLRVLKRVREVATECLAESLAQHEPGQATWSADAHQQADRE